MRDLGADHDIELHLGPGAPEDAAGAAVRAAAVHAGLPAASATRVRAITEELLREARSRESVSGEDALEVRTAVRSGRFVIEIVDRRLPLAPGASRSLPSRRLAALGFVDRLHISNRGREGNLAAIEIQLHDPTAEDLADTTVLAHDVERVSDAASEALVIREMEPSDAAGVARCVYRCYGYSYLDPIMYRPRLLRSAARSGALHPVVAVTPDGEIVGHCALSFEHRGDVVPEGGKLVVDPRYRGHHLAERLSTIRAQLAARLGVPGIWFECVTNHPFSQREVLAGGGSETGLLIGATPTAIHMEGLGNSSSGRHALLTMWTRVAGSASATVFPGARHAELLATMANGVGLERSVQKGGHRSTSGPATTRLRSTFSVDTGVVHARVHAVGDDLVERVLDELDAAAPFEPAVMHVDLPLEEPSCAAATEQLESSGFFWGAWLPDFDGGRDVLRVQRVIDPRVDVEGIECASPFGEAVRDAVLSERRRVSR